MDRTPYVEFFKQKKVFGNADDKAFFKQLLEEDKFYWNGNPSRADVALKRLPKEKVHIAVRNAGILRETYFCGYCKVNWGELFRLPPERLFNELNAIYVVIYERALDSIDFWEVKNQNNKNFEK